MTQQAEILYGTPVANALLDALKVQIETRVEAGHARPGLAVVLVGNDEASRIYVRNKIRACERTGIESRTFDLPRQTSAKALYELIDRLNEDPDIHGILVQLPLPEHIDETEVTNRISPGKDVDGFHARNVGHLALRQPGLRPCTPRGVMTLLYHYGIDPKSQHCVVVGASNIVGRPLLLELLYAGATVTCAHRFTRVLKRHVQSADILLVAIGKPGVIQSEWVSDQAIVIDIGINRHPERGLCGDVDFEQLVQRVQAITPVPGGVGPMTVATLMQNTFEASL